MQIEDNQDYYGSVISKWTAKHKGVYVITGIQQNNSGIQNQIGKVVQVRLEAGQFGSDSILLRHCDDSLVEHSNQIFWSIPERFNSYLDEFFKDTYLDDSDTNEYSLKGNCPKKGFIIESQIKAGKSTPLRRIKTAILKNLE